MATVLITGGSGLIGTALTEALLKKNYHVIILSRLSGNRHQVTGDLSYAGWNTRDQTIDKNAIARADYIIHLAGAGVADKRWTRKRKQEIINSRVKSGELLVKALKENTNHVKAVIGASAIGWYGPDPVIPNPNPFKENDPADKSFLGNTCLQWEQSLEPVAQTGKRLVRFRIGIVLSKKGGALTEFKKPLHFGIAAILGDGRQVMSWIHIEDLVRLFIVALENEDINGTYNAVAPGTISNKDFTLRLAQAKRKFFIPLHIPSFVLKMALGEMSIEALKSATVSCDKIIDSGFTFLYPSLQEALGSLA